MIHFFIALVFLWVACSSSQTRIKPQSIDQSQASVPSQSTEIDQKPLAGYDGFDLESLQSQIINKTCLEIACGGRLGFDGFVEVLVGHGVFTPATEESMARESSQYGGTIMGGQNRVLYAIFVLEQIVFSGFLSEEQARAIIMEAYLYKPTDLSTFSTIDTGLF